MRYQPANDAVRARHVAPLARPTPPHRTCLLAALLVLATLPPTADAQWTPWTGSGFPQADYRVLGIGETAPSHPVSAGRTLDLTLVLLRGSPWTEKRILSHVHRTADIYAGCGISLGRVVLARVRTEGGQHDLDLSDTMPGTQLPRTVIGLSALVPPATPWPIAFFFGKLSGGLGPARAFRRGEVTPAEARRYPYMNTAWLSFRSHWIERTSDAYSTLAHEVGHLLCECGHTNLRERHLLNGYRNFLGETVLPADCAAFRGSPLLRHSR